MTVASQVRRSVRASLAFALLALGCSQPSEPGGEPSTPTQAVAQATGKSIIAENLRQAAAKPPVAERPSIANSKQAPAAKSGPTPAVSTEGQSPAAAYQPPFPDRVDLFVPPKRQGNVLVKDGGAEDSVELLGFIRVDRPQVVLSINGQVASIAEGATQFGIEVISIQQPKVVLQRGRQRWQASLEN
jgi:hypothetical protein